MFRLPRCSSSGGLTSFQCLQKSLIKPQIEGDEFKLEADWVIFWELLPSVIGVKTWFEEKKIWTWRARRSSLAFSSGVAQTSFLGFEMTHSLSLWTTWASSKYQSIQCHSSRTLLWYVVAPPEPRARSRPRIFRDIVLSHSDESPLRCPQWPPSRARSVSSTTHCMSRRGCLRIWPCAGRRKKTGSRRRIALTEHLVAEDPNSRLGELQYWAPASVCPPPYCRVSTVCLTSHSLPTRTGMVGGWYLWILWSSSPEPAVLITFPGRGPKTGSRRRIVTKEDLAAEDPRRQVSSCPGPCLLSPLLVKGVSCLRLRQTSPEVSPCKTQRRECEEDPVGPRTVEHHSPPLEVSQTHFVDRLMTNICRFSYWDLSWDERRPARAECRLSSPKEVCRRIVSLRLPGGFPPGSPVSTQHQNYWISKFSKISFHFN